MRWTSGFLLLTKRLLCYYSLQVQWRISYTKGRIWKMGTCHKFRKKTIKQNINNHTYNFAYSTIHNTDVTNSKEMCWHNTITENEITTTTTVIYNQIIGTITTLLVLYIQGAAERSPLFGKLINSKPKKIRQTFFYFWKVHRMPFYINMFWTNHHSSGGLEYTDVASLGSCPWPWESFQV